MAKHITSFILLKIKKMEKFVRNLSINIQPGNMG
jgi:hypothetical protein